MLRQRHLSLIAVFLTASLASARVEPICENTKNPVARIREITCSNFNNPDELRASIPRGHSDMKVWLMLENCSMDYLSPGTFVNTSASILKFKDVQLGSFVEPRSNYNPFEGLEDTLEAMDFSHNSSLPESWAMLSGMHRMEELRLFKMARLNLTRDYNELPQTMKLMAVVRSTIERVDDDWLASLRNLEKVAILRSNLVNFSRSMLPRPAAKLWRLTLDFANLTSLPRDFSDQFPALREVGVRNNFITTFEEASLTHLKKNGTEVSLAGNPLHCDCRLHFLLTFPPDWYYPSCTSPESLLGQNFRDLSPEQLKCRDFDEATVGY